MTNIADRIEKTRVIRAPRARVWRALIDPVEFGQWFGVRLDAKELAPGTDVTGRITNPKYSHLQFSMLIERVDPERMLAYRWHPYAIDPAVDYSSEPRTLVEIALEDAPQGTRLTVVESGFDRIPLARRAEAFRMNEGGWAAQTENIARHVEG